MAPSSESVVSLADLKAEFERFRDETNKNIADTSIQIAELRDILTDIQNRLPSSTPATSALVNTRRDPFAKLPVELTLLIATCAMHSEDCGDPQAWLKDFSHVCWSTRKAASMYLERHINPSRIDDFDATASACRAIQTWSPKRLDNVTYVCPCLKTCVHPADMHV